MVTLVTNFNWGSALRNQNPLLTRQLSDAYGDIARVVNTKVSKYITDVDPPNPITSSQVNKALEIGDVWINTSTDKCWMMTSRTTDLLATWTELT